MDGFLVLASQIFLILCIQSILEVMASSRRENHYLKPISLAGYVASLLIVLNFIQEYVFEIINSVQRLF